MSLLDPGAFEDRSMAIIVPTRDRKIGPPWAWVGSFFALGMPMNVQPRLDVITGRKPGEAYELGFAELLERGEAYALTLEDDMIPPRESVLRLLDVLEEHPELAAVSALYYTRSDPSLPMIYGHPSKPGDVQSRPLPPVAGVLGCNIIPMGCALWRASLFRDVPRPWFSDAHGMTQDVAFCLRAGARGHLFAVDTRLRAGHRDRNTEIIY